jgi:hypothetical protein
MSANVALEYLQAKEYAMGCNGRRNMGQCPECHGVHESWLGHPLYLDSSGLGHKVGCLLAKSIRELGGAVVFVGESRLADKWQILINGRGMLDTKLAGN